MYTQQTNHSKTTHQNNMQLCHDKKPIQGVYNIKEVKGFDKPIWTKIGVAFINKDGSLNVDLDVFPIDGKMHIRDLVHPKKQGNGEQQ